MIIISSDCLTIIDTNTGGSVIAEDGASGYYIFASYPSCGKRLLAGDDGGMPIDCAKMTMREIYNAIQRNSPWMKLNCRRPMEDGGI